MKLFYQNYETDEGIDSGKPIEVDLAYATTIFHDLLGETENFLGLVDDDDNCIQFLYEAENNWLVDIPNPPGFENLQAYVTNEECLALIEDTFTQNKITNSFTVIALFEGGSIVYCKMYN